jgi:hypothetical protein
MKVLAFALALCFGAGPVAAATKPYHPSSKHSSKVKKSHMKVKKGPKASKLKHSNAKHV